ncbi:FkbM family methyltransferase [Roseomonas terrae]|uniref:FkbM family methyltransferase n=1 Tax=Neoroseomonas terrae TaxID=424799 RepID=A0ABS5EEW2_9PROT|nr:FkbM family methyltransferase [Neoroseomonas terrae]
MRTLFKLIRFLLSHPLAGRRPGRTALRVLGWQLGSRLTGMPAVLPFVPPTRLLVRPGLSSATSCLYVGLTDLAEMGFTLHLLRPGDMMGDVGANVGVYTVLAAGVAQADVVAVEPAIATLPALHDNIRLNDLADRVRVVSTALGEAAAERRVSTGRGTTNRVLVEGDADDAAPVVLATVDEVFANRVPLLLKIDTEGYEHRILLGARRLLADAGLRAIIVETAGHLGRYGDAIEALDGLLRGSGFRPFDYDPAKRALTERASWGAPNTIYLRDRGFIQDRLAAAPAFAVLGEQF